MRIFTLIAAIRSSVASGQPGSVFHPGVTGASPAVPVKVAPGRVVENFDIEMDN